MCEELGDGSTANVYSLKRKFTTLKDGQLVNELGDSNQYVAKIFKEKQHFDNEMVKINELKARIKSILNTDCNV